MESSVGKRRTHRVEAERKYTRVAVPAEPARGHRACGDEDARVVAQLPAEPRRRDERVRSDVERDRERLAGEQLAALSAVRVEQAHVLDAGDVPAPLLQARRALLGVALSGKHAPVGDDRLVRRAVERHAAVAQQHCAVAQPFDGARVVRDEDDRAAPLLELEDLPEALALERLVADGEHLVEEEHVRLDVRRDREAEPHVHARRVGAHGQVDEVLEPGERDDLVELLADRDAPQAVDRAVQVHVLAAGQIGMEAGAELEQRADAAADGDAPRGRLDDPGEQPQERRLA